MHPPSTQAFETGQIGPRRLARMLGENAPRNATIHEYLDWTVTAVEAKDETEYVSGAGSSQLRLLCVLMPASWYAACGCAACAMRRLRFEGSLRERALTPTACDK